MGIAVARIVGGLWRAALNRFGGMTNEGAHPEEQTLLGWAFGPRNSMKNGHYRETCEIGWGGPPGPRPTPPSARWRPARCRCRRSGSGTRASRADQGVRPTSGGFFA